MDSSSQETAYSKPIGLLAATTVVIASMIGVGIFTSPGYTLESLGSARIAFAAWLIGGEIAICGAVSYGALARRFADSGGEYLYLARAVHPWAGFVAGWTSLFAGFAGPTAAAAIAFSQYILDADSEYMTGVSLSLIAVATGFHIFSTAVGAWSQALLVVSKILFLALAGAAITWFAVMSGGSLSDSAATGFLEVGVGPFATSLMWIAFAYTGFNAAIYYAGEVREPAKTVPRAMILGTIVTVLLYLSLVAALYASSDQWLKPSAIAKPFHELALDMFGLDGVRVANCVVGLCLVTSVSSLTQTGPRVLSKMAADGVAPALFKARFNRPPRVAIVVQSAIAAGIVLVATLQELLTYLGMTLSLCSAAGVATLFRRPPRTELTYETDATPKPFRREQMHPAVQFAAAVYVVATITFCGLAIRHEPMSVAGTAVVIVSATIVYAVVRRIPKPETDAAAPP